VRNGAGATSTRSNSIPCDFSVVDEAERVTDAESFAVTRQLLREEGLLVGGSSGTVVAAALRVAASRDITGPVVALLADSWDRYYTQPWLRQRQRVTRYAWRDSNQSPQPGKPQTSCAKAPPPGAANCDALDASLQELIIAWPKLPEQVRTGILRVARGAKTKSELSGA
jgi:hypothetical protein